MTINFPEYTAVFPNLVFVKEREAKVLKEGQPASISVTDVWMPARYQSPTETEVLNYILEKADAVSVVSSIIIPGAQERKLEGRTPLEQVLIALPERHQRELKSRHEELLDFLRRKIPAPALEEGQEPPSYVQLTYGVIPSMIVEEHKKTGSIRSGDWYESALNDLSLRKVGFGKQWDMQLRLDEEGVLPPQADMQVLAQYGQLSGRTLNVSASLSPEPMQKTLDTLYSGLTNKEDLALLDDVSSKIKESDATVAVMQLYETVMAMEQAKAQHQAQHQAQARTASNTSQLLQQMRDLGRRS